MPMFIHELQPKNAEKKLQELSDLERDIIIKTYVGAQLLHHQNTKVTL